jgi:hypothetical protein
MSNDNRLLPKMQGQKTVFTPDFLVGIFSFGSHDACLVVGKF